MVDLGVLLGDIVQTMSFLALPALGIVFLFLVAWEDPGVARASGLTRRTFWLLVPAGLLGAIFGTLPFFGWDGSILGIDFGGGLFPLIVSALLLVGAFQPARRAVSGLAFFVLALAIETGILFAIVVAIPNGTGTNLLALAVCALAPLALFGVESFVPDPSRNRPHLAAPFAILSGVLFVTFLTTAAVPGVGIESNFPYYLIAPIGAGAISVPLTLYGYRRDPRVAPGVAYALATFGTLVGADVLRQPPLYGTGAPGFLVIGGAGLLDLLFLSGLLAAASAYIGLLVSGLRRAPVPDPTPALPPRVNPDVLLSKAVDAALGARSGESVADSAEAARISVGETRRMLGPPSLSSDRPWEGLGVPPWFEADQRNLEALARDGKASPSDVQRAWWTARSQVDIGYTLRQRRLASALRRGAAFWIDAALTLVPAAIVWAALVLYYGTGSGGPLGSLVFTASAAGYASYAYVYLVLCESAFGTTVGKSAVGLRVVDRNLERPSFVQALLRHAPTLVPLTVLGLGGALVTALAVGSSLPAASATGPVVTADLLALEILALVFGLTILILLPLGIGWIAIATHRERQRIGDRLAGTLVIVGRPEGAVPGARPPPIHSG